MAAFLRTVSLPIRAGTSWDFFSWEGKRPGDNLDYALDCTAWLTEADRVIESALVSASSGLTIVSVDYGLSGNSKTSVLVQIAGGIPLTTAQVAFELTLDSGRVLEVLVALPIRAPLPPGLMPVSGGPTADSAFATADLATVTVDASPSGPMPRPTADNSTSTSDSTRLTGDEG